MSGNFTLTYKVWEGEKLLATNEYKSDEKFEFNRLGVFPTDIPVSKSAKLTLKVTSRADWKMRHIEIQKVNDFLNKEAIGKEIVSGLTVSSKSEKYTVFKSIQYTSD